MFSIKKEISDMIMEHKTNKFLKKYWKWKELGADTSLIDGSVSKILASRIEFQYLKKENKVLRKLARINKWKCFYVDYFLCYVFSDKGQIFYRGEIFQGIVSWLRLTAITKFAMLIGIFDYNNGYVRKNFKICFGVKAASRKYGYSEEILMKPTEEILT